MVSARHPKVEKQSEADEPYKYAYMANRGTLIPCAGGCGKDVLVPYNLLQTMPQDSEGNYIVYCSGHHGVCINKPKYASSLPPTRLTSVK